MVELLRPDIKDKIDESMAITTWLNHWDAYNFDLKNIGFIVDEPGVKPAIVDFGNCLNMGFKGRHKESSKDTANQPAKEEDPDIERGGTHWIDAFSAAFDVESGMGPGGVPRRIPVDHISGEARRGLNTAMHHLHSSTDKEEKPIPRGFIKGLYRLSQLRGEDILAVCETFYPMKDVSETDKEGFHYARSDAELKQQRQTLEANRDSLPEDDKKNTAPLGKPDKNITAQEMAQILRGRIETLKTFTKGALQSYTNDKTTLPERNTIDEHMAEQTVTILDREETKPPLRRSRSYSCPSPAEFAGQQPASPAPPKFAGRLKPAVGIACFTK